MCYAVCFKMQFLWDCKLISDPALLLLYSFNVTEIVIVYRVGEDNCTGPSTAARQLACCGDEQSWQNGQAAVSRPASVPL